MGTLSTGVQFYFGDKNMKKLIALSLLFAFLMSVGCGSGGGNTDVTTGNNVTSSSDTTAAPEISIPDYELDLSGADFNILYFDAVEACGWSSAIPCDVDAEDTNGDLLNDAVYERNRRVEEMYGLKIKAHKELWEVYSVLEKSVMSASGEYDAAFVKQQGLSNPVSNGYLAELSGLLDFDKPWWDEKSLEGFGVAGKTYAIAGDVTFMDKLCDIVIFFNKNMTEDYQLGDIYQMVIDKKWTFEEMRRMCELVSADLNNNGSADKEDRFGFAGQNDSAYEFLQSAGERVCALDKDGIPYLSCNSERGISVLTKLLTFMGDETNFFNRQLAEITVNEAITMFTANRVLFLMRPLQTIMELRAMDADFGIIPTPLMDDTQTEYHTSIGFTVANCVTIPVDAKSVENSAKILDTLAADSHFNMNSTFYDMVLGTKLIRDDNSTENLDIILNSCVFDPGCIFEFGKLASKFTGKPMSADTVVSTIDSYKNQVDEDIQTLIEAIG